VTIWPERYIKIDTNQTPVRTLQQGQPEELEAVEQVTVYRSDNRHYDTFVIRHSRSRLGRA